ncbi:MAG: MerR family transcriptional regulator [Methylococcaceae bacterium]|nr:MerR family transcriptional regulator [Methylococcaceae bacterium]
MRLLPRHQRDVLKIGELAEELGTTPRTIRLYEELGLIAPARTRGGTRLYAKKDLKRMAVALRLGRSGVGLEAVQQLACQREPCATGREAVAALLPLLDELRAKIRASLRELELLESDLERADRLIQQCADCPNRPNRKDCPRCPVDQNVDSTDIARLIWDPSCP